MKQRTIGPRQNQLAHIQAEQQVRKVKADRWVEEAWQRATQKMKTLDINIFRKKKVILPPSMVEEKGKFIN